jgi:exonuclease VII large subunit
LKSRLADVTRVLEGAAARLEAYHPLSPLKRGYAVVTRIRDGRVVRSYREAPGGENIHVRLWKGRLESRVTASRPDGPPDKSWKKKKARLSWRKGRMS